MTKFKAGDRVKFKEKTFLSNGYIKEVVRSPFHSEWKCYIVKLDKKSPNEYAWNTDEVLEFGEDLEMEG